MVEHHTKRSLTFVCRTWCLVPLVQWVLSSPISLILIQVEVNIQSSFLFSFGHSI